MWCDDDDDEMYIFKIIDDYYFTTKKKIRRVVRRSSWDKYHTTGIMVYDLVRNHVVSPHSYFRSVSLPVSSLV